MAPWGWGENRRSPGQGVGREVEGVGRGVGACAGGGAPPRGGVLARDVVGARLSPYVCRIACTNIRTGYELCGHGIKFTVLVSGVPSMGQRSENANGYFVSGN